MTDIDPALTSDELTALAGPNVPRWFAVYDTSDDVIATAQVDAPLGLTYPLVALPVKNTSVNWLDTSDNQTILIGSTPGGFDRGIYRIRRDVLVSPSALAIMAVGANDSGLMSLGTRNTGISNDDYVTILNRFDPFGVFPHIDYNGVGVDGTIYEDWGELTLAQTYNRHPAPRVNVAIDGQNGHYGTHVWGGTSKTFNITINIGLWPTSSSATYAITLPSSWTLNAGSLTGSGTTATINVTAPHSASTYILKVVATENNGQAFTAYRKVWIKSFTYPPLSIVRVDSRTDDRTGSKRTVTFNSLPTITPGALWHLFDMGTWNGVDVPTANKSFSGWMQRRREITQTGMANVQLDLIGPSYMMDLIGGQSQIMYATTGTPANWQEIYNGLSYLDFILWWIVDRRASGLTQSFNWTTFGLTNAQKRMSGWQIDTGSLLQQVQTQVKRYRGGNFGCNPTGAFMLRVHPSRMPWSERSGIPVRASLTARQYKADTVLDYDAHPQVRRLRAECFVSDTTTDTPVWSDAPVVPGQGQRDDKIDRLICDNADELYEFNGNEFQARNNPYPGGQLKLNNWPVFSPAEMQRIGLDIAPALRFDGVEYTGYVLPVAVEYTHNPNGTVDTTVVIEGETVGVSGVDVPIPSPDTGLNGATRSPSNYYQRSPFIWKRGSNPNPKGTGSGATSLPKDGSLHFCGTATHAYAVTTFLTSPTYRDVTPSGLGAYSIKHGMLAYGGTRAWLLVSDGVHSRVYTTANVFAPTVSWSSGATLDGVYTILRIISGGILVESSNASVVFDYDFTSSNQGFVVENTGVTIGGRGTYSAGVGWQTEDAYQGGSGEWFRTITIYKSGLTPFTFSSMSAVVDITKGAFVIPSEYGYKGSAVVSGSFNDAIDIRNSSMSNGSNQTISGALSVSNVDELRIVVTVSTSTPGNTMSGSGVLKRLIVYGAGSRIVFSSNNGSTWGAPVSLSGTLAGFDTQYLGAVSYVGAGNIIKKATAAGGAYADLLTLTQSPTLIETPWSTRNALTLNNSGSSPEFVYGLAAPDGSGYTTYWTVGGTTPVNITPVVGGAAGLPAGPNSFATYLGKYLAYLASFSGTKHLVTSIDGGANWVTRGALDAVYARIRRQASTYGQIVLAGADLKYTNDFGSTLVTKTKPSSSDLVFWEPYA